MATINVGTNKVTFGFGAIIALVVFILCIVLAVLGRPLTTVEELGLIGALALARLT